MSNNAKKIAQKGHGLPPDVRDIFEAAQADDFESVKVALNYLPVDIRNEDTGMTPLHYAAGRASERVIDLLIERGANPFITDHFNRSPYGVLTSALPRLFPKLEQQLRQYALDFTGEGKG